MSKGEMVREELKRIRRISKMIQKISRENPDLRFMQIIGDCFTAKDLYRVPNWTLEKRLELQYNIGKG